jgi:hypothetical protein
MSEIQTVCESQENMVEAEKKRAVINDLLAINRMHDFLKEPPKLKVTERLILPYGECRNAVELIKEQISKEFGDELIVKKFENGKWVKA